MNNKDNQKNFKTAVFGGGCFWCTESVFKMIKGVKSVVPGYAGGQTVDPFYEQVLTGETFHAEVVRITYDSNVISYENLLEVFFATHDPTTFNQQGADTGTQYRSIILYKDPKEKEIAGEFIKYLIKEKIFTSPIVTEIRPLDVFFEAEDYHHNYFEKHPHAPYCQVVIEPKLEKLRKNLSRYMK